MASKRQRFAAGRKAAGYSQEQFAERVRVDRSTVVRWESGESEPQPWLRPRIARALGVPLEELDGLLAGDERLTFALSRPASVDLVAVSGLRQQVHDLDEQYDRVPSAALLARAGQYLGQVGLLAASGPGGRVRRELCAVEAEAAILMGQLVWDASQRRDHAAAYAYLDQAAAASRQCQDPIAEGLALLRKSFVALYGERDPGAGLDLTAQAAKVTAGASHVLSGLAVLHSAEAHAMLGNVRSCEQALLHAESQLARVGPGDAAIDLYSPSQFGRISGSCYLFLRNDRRAQSILEGTVASLRDRSKSHAILLGNLTLACIRQGKPDEAAVRLHEALDVIELTWGGGGLNIVFRAVRELSGWRQVPVVQDACERVIGLMAAEWHGV